MKKTYCAKKEDIVRTWFVVDASGKVLGRLASRVALILRGKHKPIYTPHIDTGDGVIIINASKVKVTGRKMQQKVYQRYSGYPGGQRQVTMEQMFAKKPTAVMQLAVKRMLPRGVLGEEMFKKLKVYSGDTHPHTAQKPVVLEV